MHEVDRARQSWRAIDLISDLHLAADMPRHLRRLGRAPAHEPADALFILGDLFEVWVGDDAAPRRLRSALRRGAADAARRRTVAFMHGNRDFLVGDALLRAAGVAALHDPTVLVAFGQRWLLTHGDALCLADVEYQRFRAEVRPTLAARLPGQAAGRAARDRARPARRQRGTQARNGARRVGRRRRRRALRWLRRSRRDDADPRPHASPGDRADGTGRVRHVLSDWDLDARAARAPKCCG